MLQKALLLLLLFHSFALSKATIDAKIDTTNKKLSNYEARYQNVHQNLAKSAKEILRAQKKVYALDRKLTKLSKELNLHQDKYTSTKNDIAKLQETKAVLTHKKENMRKELSRLMAKQLSMKIIINQKTFNDKDALIRAEVFTAISRLTKDSLEKIKKEIGSILEDEDDLSQKISTLSTSIASIDTKHQKVSTMKKRYEQTLLALNDKRAVYKKELEKTLSTKDDLRKTLQKLKIIKEDQIQKARRLAEENARKKQLKTNKDAKSINNTHVKHGDLYENVKVSKYRGEKTISPLNDYRVIKKFGPYEDPIYNIKIFNESISLKPSKRNASVRAVLNGKVILAKKTPLLGYFVIIEHLNGLHSIYAHLDKISPALRQGKRIKKGSVIGRVDDELMFEVTQKNYHINPLELIH